jgi:hypothetical protein
MVRQSEAVVVAKTYDYNTNVGKVRFYTDERESGATNYTDEEIQGLLDTNDDDVYLATAFLWDAKASAAIAKAGRETVGGVSTDYSAIAQYAMKQAEHFREKAGSEPYAETAEIGGTDFQKREILLDEDDWL